MLCCGRTKKDMSAKLLLSSNSPIVSIEETGGVASNKDAAAVPSSSSSSIVPPGIVRLPSGTNISLSTHQPLYPPGRIIHIVRQHPGKTAERYAIILFMVALSRWNDFCHASVNPAGVLGNNYKKRKLTALFFFLSSSCVGRWCRSPTEGCSTVPPSGPIYQALWADTIDFNEMLISPVMVHDHMPDTVLMALNKVTWSISHHILIFFGYFPYISSIEDLHVFFVSIKFGFFLIVLLFGGSHIIIGAEAREAACRISEANRRPLFSNHSVERLRIVGFIIFFYFLPSPFIFLFWIASARISLFPKRLVSRYTEAIYNRTGFVLPWAIKTSKDRVRWRI